MRAVGLGALVALLAASAVAAQPRTAFPAKRGFELSAFPRLVKLADDVYGYEEIRPPGFTTVSLIVIGRDGVLLADGQGSPQATQTLLDHIARLTTKPLRGTSSARTTATTPPAMPSCPRTSPTSSTPPRRPSSNATRPRRWAST